MNKAQTIYLVGLVGVISAILLGGIKWIAVIYGIGVLLIMLFIVSAFLINLYQKLGGENKYITDTLEEMIEYIKNHPVVQALFWRKYGFHRIFKLRVR